MKNLSLNAFILIILTLLASVAFSQSQSIKFNYDASGNRILRFIITKSTEASISDSAVPSTDYQNQHLANLQIVIYPNPTTDIIHIKLNSLDKDITVDAHIFSEKGEKLTSFTINGCERNYDFSNYSTGIYYLKIRIDDRVENWKIIKQ